MSVLVACEESQILTIALRANGIEAFSCDLVKCSGSHPEWHIQDDVLKLLKDDWKAIIAFPPCTHLCVSGARYFKEKQEDGSQQRAIDFFMSFTYHKCKRIAIENPIGIMSNLYRKPDQIIQPWWFGHSETKSTCLWLKNLPLLKATQIAFLRNEAISNYANDTNRRKARSKTYTGVASAMAKQWKVYLC